MTDRIYLLIYHDIDDHDEVFGAYERAEDAERAIEEDRARPMGEHTGAWLAQVEAVEWHGRGET